MRSPGSPITRLMKSVELSCGIFEHHHIAALGLAAQEAAMHRVAERPAAKGKGVAAIAIGEFLDEQIIADQQRVLHRARRDVERLEQEGADHHGDQAGIDDRLGQFAPGFALLLLGILFAAILVSVMLSVRFCASDKRGRRPRLSRI